MFFKKIKYIFIICLINEITLKLYVSGKPVDNEQIKTISSNDLNILAEYVCSDLAAETNMEKENCIEKIKKSPLPPSPNTSSIKPSSVKMRCSGKYESKFQIDPSPHWQVVVLVPQPANQTEEEYAINHAVVKPFKEYEEILTSPTSNFTLWSTEFIDGFPLVWRGGETVPAFDDMPAHKDYEVTVDFARADDNDRALVNALVKWNTYGNGDECFHIVNTCDKSEGKETKIWPDSKPERLFTKLSMDDSCNVLVSGLYGTTIHYYNTPACEYYSDCVNHTPIVPQNVSVDATQETSGTWEVRVTWLPPTQAIDRYNITVLANDNVTQEVPGNKTEAIFKGVTGEGVYDVWMRAIFGHKAAITSRRAIFPPVRGEGAGEGGGAARALLRGGAGVAGALAALAALTALVCLCRARARALAPTEYPPEDMPPKKGDMEAVSMIVESSDSWEVRSDKLLLHEVIGEGAFGVVRRATLAPSGTNVAVKMLKDFPSLEEIRSFRSEMELMKSVGVHPHLVSLVGCCSGRRPLIIAEYCSRGDLLTYLRCTWDVMVSKRNAKYYNNNVDTSDYRNDLFKCKIQTENSKLVVNKLYELQDICDKELTSLDLLSFCRQIAMGMEFLAANRVVHRDLAARNVLVTADRTLKIADFGLSRDVYEENQYKQKGNGKMPVKWMALESLTRRIYTTQSDVWSFGVVVWEVATVGAAPYPSVPAARLPRLLRAGYRMPRPANCSPQLYDIMLSCWRAHPRERPTFTALHARLDELLLGASAHHYLALELEPLDAPPTPKHHRYIRMFMRGKRNWSRAENYERPLKPPQSNHYTSPPVVLSKAPPV